MTATITITAVTAQRVTLQVVESDSGNGRCERIVRTDANGTHNLRVPAGTFPLSAGTHTLFDYEAAMVTGSTVKWTAYNMVGAASGTLTGPVWDYPHRVYLTCPTIPALGLPISIPGTGAAGVVVRYDEASRAATTLHQIVGRDDPIPVLRPSALPAGTFDVTYDTLDAALDLRDTLARGYVWMLRQSDQANLDMYFVVVSTTLTHSDQEVRQSPRPERRWSLAVEFAQVAAPGPDITLLPGWTYAVVAASYSSYGALLPTFDTYADLLTRTVS